MAKRPRVVAYHTGAGETAKVLSDPKNEKRGILDALSGAGYVVTSITSTKDHWGSPVSLKANDALYAWIRSDFSTQKIGLLCQSMGGLSAYNWACRNPKAVLGVYGIYPVTNLAAMLRGPAGPVIAKVYERQEIDLSKEISTFDPIQQIGPLSRGGVPAKHRHGDADALVEYEPNALRFAQAYAKSGGRFELVPVKGLGHQVDPSFFNAEEVLGFMDSLNWDYR
jgi:pimeloyl-ACP methyl ester carboxylesterase